MIAMLIAKPPNSQELWKKVAELIATLGEQDDWTRWKEMERLYDAETERLAQMVHGAKLANIERELTPEEILEIDRSNYLKLAHIN